VIDNFRPIDGQTGYLLPRRSAVFNNALRLGLRKSRTTHRPTISRSNRVKAGVKTTLAAALFA
jgi:hypothetical protein